jgi:hypothetical protein
MVTDLVNCDDGHGPELWLCDKDCFQKNSCGYSRHVSEEVLW